MPFANTPIERWVQLDSPQLSARVRNAFENLRDGWHPRVPKCRTLGDVASLSAADIYMFRNCGRGTVRALQESLARAGLSVAWCVPGLAARHERLRNDLTVLAAAWASNANHEPETGVATAWKSASDALDKLLGTD